MTSAILQFNLLVLEFGSCFLPLSYFSRSKILVYFFLSLKCFHELFLSNPNHSHLLFSSFCPLNFPDLYFFFFSLSLIPIIYSPLAFISLFPHPPFLSHLFLSTFSSHAPYSLQFFTRVSLSWPFIVTILTRFTSWPRRKTNGAMVTKQ